jgi:hypothetical protein
MPELDEARVKKILRDLDRRYDDLLTASEESLPILEKLIEQGEQPFASAAVCVAALMVENGGEALVVQASSHRDWTVRVTAAHVLPRVSFETAESLVPLLLSDRNDAVVYRALRFIRDANNEALKSKARTIALFHATEYVRRFASELLVSAPPEGFAMLLRPEM